MLLLPLVLLYKSNRSQRLLLFVILERAPHFLVDFQRIYLLSYAARIRQMSVATLL